MFACAMHLKAGRSVKPTRAEVHARHTYVCMEVSNRIYTLWKQFTHGAWPSTNDTSHADDFAAADVADSWTNAQVNGWVQRKGWLLQAGRWNSGDILVQHHAGTHGMSPEDAEKLQKGSGSYRHKYVRCMTRERIVNNLLSSEIIAIFTTCCQQ